MSRVSLRHRVEYWGFRLFYSLIPHVSRKNLKKIADQLGILGYLVAGGRRRIARINLDIAFGDKKNDQEKEDLIIASFQNLIFIFLDGIWLSRNLNPHNWKEIVEVEGIELMQSAARRGKGIICPVAHFGNWEMMGVICGLIDIPCANYVARRQNNPLIDQYIKSLRTATGSKIIYKDEAMTKILSALRRNESVGIVFDQNVIESLVFVDFFGVPAATTKSVAIFALSGKAAVIPATSYPLPDLRYRVVFGPELTYPNTGKVKNNIMNFTQQCVKHIEGYIKKEPQFYLWGHRRYKERPPGEPKIY